MGMVAEEKHFYALLHGIFATPQFCKFGVAIFCNTLI